MKFDESLIRENKKIFYLGCALGVLVGIGATLIGILEHDWILILYSPVFVVIMIGVAFFIKRF